MLKFLNCQIHINPDIFSVYEKIELIKIGAAMSNRILTVLLGCDFSISALKVLQDLLFQLKKLNIIKLII